MGRSLYELDLELFEDIDSEVGRSLPRGGGDSHIISDGGDRQKFGKETLKGTKISFCGRGSNSFSSLRGTNSKTKLVPVIIFPDNTLKSTGITLTAIILHFTFRYNKRKWGKKNPVIPFNVAYSLDPCSEAWCW